MSSFRNSVSWKVENPALHNIKQPQKGCKNAIKAYKHFHNRNYVFRSMENSY